MKKKNNIDKSKYFRLTGILEDFILSQYQSHAPDDSIFTGGYRFERKKNDPAHWYKLASYDTLNYVKNYYKEKIEKSSWENMFSAFFIDYHNYNELTYTMYEIDKAYKDKDWEGFINHIPTTRITGCTSTMFQRALQENNIVFKVSFTLDQSRFDDWMTVEWNKQNILVLKHSNIGNY